MKTTWINRFKYQFNLKYIYPLDSSITLSSQLSSIIIDLMLSSYEFGGFFVINDHISPVKIETYAIKGEPELKTIFDFYENKIKIEDSLVAPQFNGKSFLELPRYVQRLIGNNVLKVNCISKYSFLKKQNSKDDFFIKKYIKGTRDLSSEQKTWLVEKLKI